MENTLACLSDELGHAVQAAGRHVAAVQARSRLASSGVVWRSGVVVTAEHTIRRHDNIRVTLPDGKTVNAELAGRDPGTDLAVLKFETDDTPVPLLTNSQTLTPGQIILAVGRSPEYGVTANLGIVGGVGGPWNTWRGGHLDRFLRLDIGLHTASSGAAVVDTKGHLAGIATAGLTRAAPIAIPSESVDRVVDALLREGHVARGYLGVGLQPVRLSENHIGLMVLSVEPGSPAAASGLFIGDTLLALDGAPVSDTDDVLNVLEAESIGRTLRMAILRAGERKEMAVTIAARARRNE